MKRIDEELSGIILKKSISAKKNFGQNFLLDLDILEVIKGFINGDSHKSCVEIGCGIGTLTRFLDDKYQNFIGYEIERDMLDVLKSEYSFKNLDLKNEDFLKADLSYLNEEYLVIGNIPYNITSKVIKKILALDRPISFAFMVQKEVAEKYSFMLNSTRNNPLATYFAIHGKYKVICDVNKSSFVPSPKVDSAFIYYQASSANYKELKALDFLYMNPHKTLRNNFKHLDESVSSTLASIVDTSKRIHQLSIEEIKSILKVLTN